MDPIKPKFFQCDFDLFFLSENIKFRGLVSEQGITKVYIPKDLPAVWQDAVGQAVCARIDGIDFPAVLMQQFIEHGTYFEVRFRNLDENQKKFLRQRISTEGISPSWQRQFPRIPVQKSEDPDLPVPNLCIVRFAGQELFVKVIDFTIGGLRIETIGHHLREVRPGAILHFDIATNTGVVLAGLTGEVRNVADHTHPDKTVSRSLGIKLVELDPTNKRKYKELIRDYCLVMKQKFVDDEEEA